MLPEIPAAPAPTVVESSLSPIGLINKTDVIEWNVEFDSLVG